MIYTAYWRMLGNRKEEGKAGSVPDAKDVAWVRPRDGSVFYDIRADVQVAYGNTGNGDDITYCAAAIVIPLPAAAPGAADTQGAGRG